MIVSHVLYDNPLVITIVNTQSFLFQLAFSINFMDLVLVVKKLDVEMTKDTYKTVIMTVHCLLSDVMTSNRLRQVSI